MMEPSFWEKYPQMAAEKLKEMGGNVAHKLSPVTDRIALLGNDPKQFAKEGLEAFQRVAVPAIGQAAAPAAVPLDPAARPGVPNEAMPASADPAATDAQRKQNILDVLLQRYRQQ